MAEPTQFTFDLKEVAELLVKKQGLHSGRWMIAAEFSVTIGAVGTDRDRAKPGAMVMVNNLQLMRAPETGEAPPNLVVDAAEINPKT